MKCDEKVLQGIFIAIYLPYVNWQGEGTPPSRDERLPPLVLSRNDGCFKTSAFRCMEMYCTFQWISHIVWLEYSIIWCLPEAVQNHRSDWLTIIHYYSVHDCQQVIPSGSREIMLYHNMIYCCQVNEFFIFNFWQSHYWLKDRLACYEIPM